MSEQHPAANFPFAVVANQDLHDDRFFNCPVCGHRPTFETTPSTVLGNSHTAAYCSLGHLLVRFSHDEELYNNEIAREELLALWNGMCLISESKGKIEIHAKPKGGFTIE